MSSKNTDKPMRTWFGGAELPIELLALLTSRQQDAIDQAADEGRPILVTGPQGPTGKTTLTEALRAAGVTAYEPHEMEVVELTRLFRPFGGNPEPVDEAKTLTAASTKDETREDKLTPAGVVLLLALAGVVVIPVGLIEQGRFSWGAATAAGFLLLLWFVPYIDYRWPDWPKKRAPRPLARTKAQAKKYPSQSNTGSVGAQGGGRRAL